METTEKDIRAKIGQRIKAARLAAGMTQTELAEKICVCHTTIAMIELGINMPGLNTFLKIKDVLKMGCVCKLRS